MSTVSAEDHPEAAAPIADTVANRRVHPATVPLRFLKDAPSMVLGLPAAYTVASRGSLSSALLIAVVVAAAAILLNAVAWLRFRYGVGAHDVVIESGILTRTRRSIPFDRVQDVDIERGPLQRLFGLATVRIETGGAAKDEGLIDSVTVAEADRLRAAVRAGRAREVFAEAGVVPVVAPSRIVFAMGLPRVLGAGLFNFSLLYLAALFSLLQTFKRLLPFDIDDPASWVGAAQGPLRDRLTLTAVLAAVFVATAAGVVFGVAGTLASDYGFRLSAEGARLRRTRGLLTRSEVALPKRRVQLALRGTGPLRRALGWSELHFQTLSGAGGQGRSAASTGGGRQAVAPLAREDEIAAILAEQGDLSLPDPAALIQVSSRHVVRTLLKTALLPTISILVLGAFWRPGLVALGLVPALIVVALLERRRHRYLLSGGLLFIARGVWNQQLWIVPVARAQTIALSRSLLQRWLSVATVAIDTAGASGLGGPAVVDLREDRARSLMEAIAAGGMMGGARPTPEGSPEPTDTAPPYRS